MLNRKRNSAFWHPTDFSRNAFFYQNSLANTLPMSVNHKYGSFAIARKVRKRFHFLPNFLIPRCHKSK